jgi:hypothetical protein
MESPVGALWGFFFVDGMTIISSGPFHDAAEGVGDWEHVSVSRRSRCPEWHEMARVKQMFWDKTETVLQFHPPESEYVNLHPFCLHLWKPRWEIVLPPLRCV